VEDDCRAGVRVAPGPTAGYFFFLAFFFVATLRLTSFP